MENVFNYIGVSENGLLKTITMEKGYKVVNIKPISVNEMYSGKFRRSEKYKLFKQSMKYNLAVGDNLDNKKLKKVDLIIYFSNKGADVDGPIKSILDSLQECYGFNDNLIYELSVKKKIVKKGEEKIEFRITDLEEDYNYKE